MLPIAASSLHTLKIVTEYFWHMAQSCSSGPSWGLSSSSCVVCWKVTGETRATTLHACLHFNTNSPGGGRGEVRWGVKEGNQFVWRSSCTLVLLLICYSIKAPEPPTFTIIGILFFFLCPMWLRLSSLLDKTSSSWHHKNPGCLKWKWCTLNI